MVIIADGRYELPDNLYYSSQHVYVDKDKKIIGLDQIGYAFLKNPKEFKILADNYLDLNEPIAVISTDIGITTLKSPVKGRVKKTNKDALNDMENDTYTKGFIIEMESIEDIDPTLIGGRADIEKWGKNETRSLLYGQYAFKVIEIGDSTVGKTAMKVRLTDDYFKQDLKTTLGVDFGSKELKCEYVGSDILFGSHRFSAKMNVWDAAGQEHFSTMRGMYYRGAKGCLLIYDVTNPVSFQNLDKWLEELEDNLGKKVPTLLIGNKIDLERVVPKNDALEYARSKNLLYFETSAKTGAGVINAFKKLAVEVYKAEEAL